MPVCEKIRGKKRQVCLGDKDHLVTIQDRNLQTPGAVDPTNNLYFTEAFTNIVNFQVWAMVDTVRGEEFFDGTNLGVAITHHLTVNYDVNITAQQWVILENGDLLNIVTVENIDAREIDMLLFCTNRGPQDNSNNDL